MTDATNPKKGEGTEGASPEAQKPEPKEPSKVPLKALSEERAKKRELAEELDEVKAELARLKEQKQPEAPKSEPAPSESKEALEEIRQFRAEQRRAKLVSELGLDDKQTDAVEAILKELPSMNPREALTIASLRNEKLFESRGQAGFDPSQHGSLRPTPGAQPVSTPKTLKQKVADIAAMQKTDRVRADAMFNDLMEAEMYKACDMPHPLNK